MPDFTEILGNRRNIEHLSEACQRGRLSHAYIINGPAGSGKKTFAGYIAAALLCEQTNRPGPDKRRLSDGPCMRCPSCAKAMSQNHPDIIRLRREKDKVITVGEVRQQIIDDISIKPYYGPYKIYIIEDAQLMNENAQNALLKTIEEPPEYAVIFLLSDNADAFLDTIRSRCIRMDMERLPGEDIRKYITGKFKISEKDADAISAFSRGNLGQAIDLAGDEDGTSFTRAVVNTLKNVTEMNAVDIYDAAESIAREDAQEALRISRMWFRDALVIKAGQGSSIPGYYFPQETEYFNEFAGKISYEGLNNNMEAIDRAQARLDSNVKAEAVLENLFLALRRNYRK